MRKFIKITLLTLLCLIILVLGGAVYFSTKIKPILMAQLNEQLTVKVEVEDISLSAFADFPRLGLKFKNIKIHESQPYHNKPLLNAQELNLYVNLIKLLSKEYVIDGITMKNGSIRLADLDRGSNYDIIKSDSNQSSSLDFSIKKITFQNCYADYRHLPSGFQFNGTFEKNFAKLKSSGAGIQLSVNGLVEVDSMKQDADRYLHGQTVDLATEILLNQSSTLLTILPSQLKLEGITLNTEGSISLDQTTFINLTFNNEEAALEDIATILPSYIQSSIEHLNLKGFATIIGYFKGKIDDKHNPSFGFTYDLKDAEVQIKDQPIALNRITSSGELKIPDLGDMTSAWVQVKLNKAATGNNDFSGDLHIENFDVPLIKWEGHAALDAQTISGLAGNESISLNSGRLNAKGKLQLRYHVANQEIIANSFKYLGTLNGRNITGAIQSPTIEIKALNFNLEANHKHVVVKQCKLDYNRSKAALVGYILNADQLFNASSNTEVTGKLTLENIDLNEFLSSDSSSNSTEKSSTGKPSKDILPIKLALKTTIKHLKYNDFHAESIMGTLYSDRRKLSIPDARLKALKGEIDAHFTLSTFGDNYLLDLNTKLRSVDISEMFREFNEFNQEEITSKHLSGSLSGKILSKLIFDKHYNPQLDKLYAKADIEIVDGQLINYEPLKSLSRFVQVKELENVRFTSLKNTIEIFNQTIFIPKMFIGNNAMSLELEGTHTFENYMNYRINVSLAEILANKTNWWSKKVDNNLNVNKQGGLTAYILMEGTPENLTIKYDKLAVDRVIGNEVEDQTDDIRRALQGEALEEEVPDDYYEDIWDE